MQAASNTPNASKPKTAVINQAQTVRGSRPKVMPLARRSTVVVMKFSAPSSEAMQKIAKADDPQGLAGALSRSSDLAQGA